MKRILWLTENYPPSRGGMAHSCDRIVYGLRQRGFRVDLVHYTNRLDSGKPEVLANGSRLVCSVWPENESHTLLMAWKQLEQNVKPWDFMVAFGGSLPVLAAPVYAAWLKIPLVVMLRGNDFDTAVFSSRKREILRDALESAQLVISVSQDKLLRAKLLFPKVPMKYVPNGIELENWSLTGVEEAYSADLREEISPGRLLTGCFGHLKAKKGIELLLEFSGSSMIRENFTFLLIGDLEEELKQQLEISGLNFQLLPFMDRYELLPYYQACDLVLLSSHYDGMPNVLLEAGALGKLVIGSATDGMRDVLRDGENGLLFRTANAEHLKEKLFQVLEMPVEKRDALGEQLKREVRENYNSEVEIRNYEQIFSQI
jgi:glycosyltransferase involved in cell wall biosynthesis